MSVKKYPADWKKLQVPLGLVVTALIALAGAWGYAHSEFVLAQDFRQYQQSVEIRGLERDKRQAEFEILKLEVKRDAYPAKFDRVDAAILNKQKNELAEIKQQIKDAKTGSAK